MAIYTPVTLYKYNGDTRKVNKQFESTPEPLTIKAYLNDACDVISPVISVPYSVDYYNYNYAYIPSWDNRYYFINDYSTDGAGKLYLHFAIDVLKTYKDAIMDADVTVVRSESIGHPTYVPDDQYPVYPTLSDVHIDFLHSPEKPFMRTGEVLNKNILMGVI